MANGLEEGEEGSRREAAAVMRAGTRGSGTGTMSWVEGSNNWDAESERWRNQA